MLRFLLITALLSSLFFLVRESLFTLQNEVPPPVQETVEPQAVPVPETIAMPAFHQPPMPLPDLNKGYLFNAERLLESDEIDEEKENKLDIEEAEIDFDSVSYVGSIITNKRRKAIVSYSDQPQQTQRRRPSRRIRGRTVQPAPAAGPQKYVQLLVGDDFHGYKVTVIEPDRIVFERDDDTIEKLLYDPDKKRLAVLPTTPARAHGTNPKARTPAASGPITVGAPEPDQEETLQTEPTTETEPMEPVRPPPAAVRRRPVTGTPSPVLRRRLPRVIPPGSQPSPPASTSGQENP